MIRRADPGDVNALRAIAAAAYQKYAPRIGWNPAPMTADYAQAVRNRQAWAAVEDGEIAGFAILIARPGYLVLDNVAVLPAAQGRGIGARLLALAEDHARGVGLSEIRLYTSEAMTRTSPTTPGTGIRRPTGPSETAFAGCSSVNPSTDHPTRGVSARFQVRRRCINVQADGPFTAGIRVCEDCWQGHSGVHWRIPAAYLYRLGTASGSG